MEQKLIDGLDNARSSATSPSHARRRIAALCDPRSFVEYGQLARAGMGVAESAGAGLIGGLARMGGLAAVVATYDVAADDGNQTGVNQGKIERLVFMALEHAWPFVCFVDGGGDEEPGAGAGVSALGLAGTRIGLFDGLAELSGSAPIVAILSGTALGSHAALAMFADFFVAVAGSRLGDDEASAVPVEEHERLGDVDLVVAEERDAIDAARRYIALLRRDEPTGRPSPNASAIANLIPENRRRAYDMRRVIDGIADHGSALELRPNWGTSMITSLVRMGGRTVGLFANQPKSRTAGAIDADAADKMARFIELCDAHNVPLLSLIDSPGFHIGPEAERGGIARHHVRTLSALEHRDVPLYCVQIRKAYGLGPLVMRGSWGHLPPELRLAWPTVETGGMSLEGAAYLARRKQILAAETPEEARAIRDEYAETLRARDSGLRAGQNFSFDDIIHPGETRERIIAMLDLNPRQPRTSKKTYLDTI